MLLLSSPVYGTSHGAAFRVISDDDESYQSRLSHCLINQNVFIEYSFYEDYHEWTGAQPDMQSVSEKELYDSNNSYAEHADLTILIAYDLASNSFGLAKGKGISDELLTPENIKELKREYTSIKRDTLQQDINACRTSIYIMLFTNHPFAYNLAADELMHSSQEQKSLPASVPIWLWIVSGILAAVGVLFIILLVFKPKKITYQAIAILLILCCTYPLFSIDANAGILYGIGGTVSQEEEVKAVLTEEQIDTLGKLRLSLSNQLGFSYFIYFVDDIENDEQQVLNEKLVKKSLYNMAVIVSQKQDKIIFKFSDKASPFFTSDDVTEIDTAFGRGGDLYTRLKNGLDETVIRLYAGRNLLKDENIDAILASRPSVPAQTEPVKTQAKPAQKLSATDELYIACALLFVVDGVLLTCWLRKRKAAVPKD